MPASITYRSCGISLCALLAMNLVPVSQADAQRRAGAGRTGAATMDRPGASSRQVRSSASSNINYGNRRGTTGAINTGNRANINRGNINSGNINTGDINVKVDNRRYYGWGGYYRPVATGVAVGVATAAVIGSYYSTLPAGCVLIYRGSLSYYQCGSVWYQPVYSGMHVQYVVVAAP